MPDDLPDLAAQRARRRARSNPDALARKIESAWRADPASGAAEIAEERAIRDGVGTERKRRADRLERERIRRNLANPHGRVRDGSRWRPCNCDRRSGGPCPVLESAPLAPAGSPGRAESLAARDWLDPQSWAEASGLRRVAREESERAEAWAYERVVTGMAFVFRIFGDLALQNSVVQARLRELYAQALYASPRAHY
jgi:hypothetical protein